MNTKHHFLILFIFIAPTLVMAQVSLSERIRNLIPLNPNPHTTIHPVLTPGSRPYQVNHCITQAFPGSYNPNAIQIIDNLLAQSIGTINPSLRINPGLDPGISNPLFMEVVSRIRNEILNLNRIWAAGEIYQQDMESIIELLDIIGIYNFYANKIENLDMLPENALNISRIILQFQSQLTIMRNCLLPIVQSYRNEMALRIDDHDRQSHEGQNTPNNNSDPSKNAATQK